jgi:hypothetical protein
MGATNAWQRRGTDAWSGNTRQPRQQNPDATWSYVRIKSNVTFHRFALIAWLCVGDPRTPEKARPLD